MLKYKTQVREKMKYTKQVFFLSYYKGLMTCIKIVRKYILFFFYCFILCHFSFSFFF